MRRAIFAALTAIAFAVAAAVPAAAFTPDPRYDNYRQWKSDGYVYAVRYYDGYHWGIELLSGQDWVNAGRPAGAYVKFHSIPVIWEDSIPSNLPSNTAGWVGCYGAPTYHEVDGIHVYKPYAMDENPAALPNILRHEYMHVLQCRAGQDLNERQADAGAWIQGSPLSGLAYLNGQPPTDQERQFAQYYLDACEDAYGTPKGSRQC